MSLRRVAGFVGAAGLALALQACVVRETRPVNAGYGYGYGYQTQASVTVGAPNPYYVSSMPPQPLYETMSPSPGYGYAWLDGYWHWNGYEWVWISGRWERQQDGYVYIQPYYDYSGGAYVYTPGYWQQRDQAPASWNVGDHRDGRPTTYAPRPGWHGNPPVGTASGGVSVGGQPGRPVVQPPPVSQPPPVAQPPTVSQPPQPPPGQWTPPG